MATTSLSTFGEAVSTASQYLKTVSHQGGSPSASIFGRAERSLAPLADSLYAFHPHFTTLAPHLHTVAQDAGVVASGAGYFGEAVSTLHQLRESGLPLFNALQVMTTGILRF